MLELVLTGEVCAAAGPVQLTVELSSGGQLLATWPVTVGVLANPSLQSLDGAVLKGTWAPNMSLATDEGGNVVTVAPTQRAVELDASGYYSDGILVVTYADGSSDSVAVRFDSADRPVTFVNGDETFTVVWPEEVAEDGA